VPLRRSYHEFTAQLRNYNQRMEIKITMKNVTDFDISNQILHCKLVSMGATFSFGIHKVHKASKPGAFNMIWEHSWKERHAHKVMISGVLIFVTRSKLLCTLRKAILPRSVFIHLKNLCEHKSHLWNVSENSKHQLLSKTFLKKD